eukprot:TRINITY_DN63651_c0_g1_i1.p1 TRINITY_DN63651_c0_g1~~TRINITY_DN63651_c0_g1_i1.p1  ORF type:complete len:782 (-),score=154.43 TRINITY_DN63651_c0_g1_i1:252-2597(-)
MACAKGCLAGVLRTCLGWRDAESQQQLLQHVGRRCESTQEEEDDVVEVCGMPMHYYVRDLCQLDAGEQARVRGRIQEDLARASTRARARDADPTSLVVEARDARVELLTWNVGGISWESSTGGTPGAETQSEKIAGAVRELISSTLGKAGAADVVAVALQEVIPLTVDNALMPPRSTRALSSSTSWPKVVVNWVELLRRELNSDAMPHNAADGSREHFVLYGQPVYLFGLLLMIFCRAELIGTHITAFRTFQLPVDMFHTGTKGFVACRFSLFHRSFCFINCHLEALKGGDEASNVKAFKARIEQLRRCIEEVVFRIDDQVVHPAVAHRAVFIMGDTNMRLVTPPGFLSHAAFAKYAKEEAEAGRWAPLLEHDQLARALRRQDRGTFEDPTRPVAMHLLTNSKRKEDAHELAMWREAALPSFPPTFKLEVPGPGYSTKRAPAWTDRILYRSRCVRPDAYRSAAPRGAANISDHAPVFGRFEVSCVIVNVASLSRFVRQVRYARSADGSSPAQLGNDQALAEQALDLQRSLSGVAAPLAERWAHRVVSSLMSKGLAPADMLEASQRLMEFHQDSLEVVEDTLQARACHALETCSSDAVDNSGRQKLDLSLLEGELQDALRDIRGKLRRMPAATASPPPASASSSTTALAPLEEATIRTALPPTVTTTILAPPSVRVATTLEAAAIVAPPIRSPLPPPPLLSAPAAPFRQSSLAAPSVPSGYVAAKASTPLPSGIPAMVSGQPFPATVSATYASAASTATRTPSNTYASFRHLPVAAAKTNVR